MFLVLGARTVQGAWFKVLGSLLCSAFIVQGSEPGKMTRVNLGERATTHLEQF